VCEILLSAMRRAHIRDIATQRSGFWASRWNRDLESVIGLSPSPSRGCPVGPTAHSWWRARGRAWGGVAVVGGNHGDWVDRGAVGPSLRRSPPVRDCLGRRGSGEGPGERWPGDCPEVRNRAGGCGGSDRVCGLNSLSRSYLIPASIWCFMSGQSIPGSKGKQERSVNKIEGLTPGERQRLEESMRRNEKLMKRLAEM
jgi:hypothetical protein